MNTHPLRDRREFLAACAAFGLTPTLFPGVLWSLAKDKPAVTKEMIDEAGAVAGVFIADDHKALMLDGLNDQLRQIEALRKVSLPNAVAPAFHFDPVPPGTPPPPPGERRRMRMSDAPDVAVPDKVEGLAFATVRELAELLRAGKVTSVALTEMYLSRLKRLDKSLLAVITFTEERALAQARQADLEIAAGKYRGPL